MSEEQNNNLSADLSAAQLTGTEKDQIAAAYAAACAEDDRVRSALGQRYTKSQILCAIIENFGIRNQVCKALDCTKAQLARYISVHPDLIAVERSAREMLMDKCESTLVRALDSQSEMSQLRAAEILMKTVGAKKYNNAALAVEVDAKDTKVRIMQIFGLEPDKSNE